MTRITVDDVVIRDYSRGELHTINSIEPDPMDHWADHVESLACDMVSIEVGGKLAGCVGLVGLEVVAAMDRTVMRGHSRSLVTACRTQLDKWGPTSSTCQGADRHSQVWLKWLGFDLVKIDEVGDPIYWRDPDGKENQKGV